MRGWALDWLNRADPAACEQLLSPSYRITIAGQRIEGRDAYVAATLGQLERFPGLGLTVHELICSQQQRVAVRFTEHGPAARLGWRAAAWSGVALFRVEEGRLSECFAEEDYLGRRRQLDSGLVDVIEPPAPAPWSAPCRPADAEAEGAVYAWLQRGRLEGVGLDDGAAAPILFDEVRVELDELFSAGERVAFHGTLRGRYVRGLAEAPPDASGAEAVMHLAGLVSVAGGAVVGGRVIRDRLGMIRALGGAGS